MDRLTRFLAALAIIGLVNWALVGVFDFDLIRAMFRSTDFAPYLILAVAGLFAVVLLHPTRRDPELELCQDRPAGY